MDETLSIVQEAFGAYDLDEDRLGEVADALDSALGGAFQCALDLYHPAFGIYADANLSPAEAVDSVLADIAAAAPAFPIWARVGDEAEDDSIVRFALNEAVDEVVQGILAAAFALGWVTMDDLLDMTDSVIESGKRILTTLVQYHGYAA